MNIFDFNNTDDLPTEVQRSLSGGKTPQVGLHKNTFMVQGVHAAAAVTGIKDITSAQAFAVAIRAGILGSDAKISTFRRHIRIATENGLLERVNKLRAAFTGNADELDGEAARVMQAILDLIGGAPAPAEQDEPEASEEDAYFEEEGDDPFGEFADEDED